MAASNLAAALYDIDRTRVILKGDKLVRVIRTPVDYVSSLNDFLPLVPVDFERTTSNYGDMYVVFGMLVHGEYVTRLLEVVNCALEIAKADGCRPEHQITVGGVLGSVESVCGTTSIQLCVASSQ